MWMMSGLEAAIWVAIVLLLTMAAQVMLAG
jgi:hypothetical protein